MTTNQERAAEVIYLWIDGNYGDQTENSETAVQALADAGLLTPDLPEPEDVKPDPQPGEAWLIEYEGKRYEAVYWYSPIYAHWSFVEGREDIKTVESPEATPVSRLVMEGWV